MSKIHHPMRYQEFTIYNLCEGTGGHIPNVNRLFIAFFSDYQKYPMYFHGSTYEECLQRAVAFRDSEATKHEKNYLVRIEALRKAREAKKKYG